MRGASANRLRGADIATATVIAVISAGPDRIFQTSCADYVSSGTPVVNKPADSDDIVKEVSYGSFLLPRSSQARIGELPNEACTPQTIGIMRLELGVVQVCMDTGWEETGTAAQADGNFQPVENAPLGQMFTSNQVSFTGFMNKKTVTVEGAAILLVNGVVVSSPAQIQSGDFIQLRASAPSVPEQVSHFAASVSGVRKTWTITARNRTPVNLLISPSPVPSFIVDGESGTAYGNTIEFMLTNTGEERAIVAPSSLTNNTNFEILSNGCASATLARTQSCAVTVRSRAEATGVHTGNLNFYATGEHYGGSHSPVAGLSSDALFPVVLANNGSGINLSTLAQFTASGRWASARPKRVIVPAGVVIGSSSPSTPAMRSGTGRGGSLTITVNGEIQGAGGQPNSGEGGAAFLAEQSGISLINNGAIRAGGGAGGRGGNGGNGGAGYYSDYRRDPPSGYHFSAWSTGWLIQSSCGNTSLRWFGDVTNHGCQGGWSQTTLNRGDGWIYERGPHHMNDSWSHYGIARYLVTPVSAHTGGGGGGIGGNGGQGQGYGVPAAGGAGGSAGAGGGLNAGTGGNGGNGGAGGAWGSNGIGGNNGAWGSSGNNGGGGAGGGGGGGGLSGFAIQNSGFVARSGGGVLQGRL